MSRSGYYDWLNRPKSPREKENEELLEKIKELYEKHNKNYGSYRIYQQLRQDGYNCNKKRVERLMKEAGLKARRSKKYKVTTDSNHSMPVSENKVKRNFHTEAPDELWVSDISYIWTQESWLYLATVMDVYTRKIVGWAMDKVMNTNFTIRALEMALNNRNPSEGLIHHSDRGVQYASQQYQELMSKHGIISSMSRKGDCWDNAVMESFFKTLKAELIYWNKYKTLRAAARDIFEYIEIYYNKKRLHSALGYITPHSCELRSKVA